MKGGSIKMAEEKEPAPIKKELKLKLSNSTQKWEIVNAKGFYPAQETWTKDELRVFSRENDDVKLNLVY
jgi:hypothetical protein